MAAGKPGPQGLGDEVKAQALALHADGQPMTAIAERLRISLNSVKRIIAAAVGQRRRYLPDGAERSDATGDEGADEPPDTPALAARAGLPWPECLRPEDRSRLERMLDRMPSDPRARAVRQVQERRASAPVRNERRW